MMKNESGFTLLEAIIALMILSIGIIGAAVMQIQAVNANSNGMARTMANAVGLSFMEELKRLPFSDPNLIDTNGDNAAGLNKGSNIGGAVLDPSQADHQFVPANFPNFANTYKLVNGNLVDDSGRRYQIFWNVDQSALVAGSPSPFCKITLFVYWQTPMGQQHLQLSSVKYNNIKV